MPEYLKLRGKPNIAIDDNDLKTVTRIYDVVGQFATKAELDSKVKLAWGTADEEFTECFLVNQQLEGGKSPNEDRLTLVRTYQEATSTLTLIQNVTQQESFEGRTIFRIPYIILTANVYDPGVIPAIGSDTYLGAVLFEQSVEIGKVVSRLVQSYVHLEGGSFILNTSERETENGVTITSQTVLIDDGEALRTVGTAYAEGTLIDISVTETQGLRQVVYTYSDLSAPVIYSVRTNTQNNGALTVYNLQAVGLKGGSAPDWSAYSSYALIDQSERDSNNLTFYTRSYATGTGVISERETFRSESSFEKVYTEITANGAAAPNYTGVNDAVLSQSKEERDGYEVWTTRVFTLGATSYEIDRSERENENQTTTIRSTMLLKTGVALRTIGSSYAEGYLIAIDEQEAEGPKRVVYTYSDVSGPVIYDESTQERNNGQLFIKTYRGVGEEGGDAPDWGTLVPAGYVLVNQSERTSQYLTFYDRTYAKGVGVISTRIDEQEEDSQQITYTEITAPGATAPDHSGTNIIQLSQTEREENGYQIWTTVVLALAADRIDLGSTETKNRDGSVRITWRWKGTNGTNPNGPPSAGTYIVSSDYREITGAFRQFTEVWITPPTDKTIANGGAVLKTVNWQYPGWAAVSSGGLGLTPPTNRRLVANVEVTHSTSKTTDTPWSPDNWAAFTLNYTRAIDGYDVWRSEGLRGYLANSSYVSAGGSWQGVECDGVSANVVSDPTSLPSGTIIIDVQSEPYLEDTSGTIVYRNSVTKVTLT